jgi:hypothetical protein
MLSQLLSREQSLGRTSNPGILLTLLTCRYVIVTEISRVVNDHVMLLSTLKSFVQISLYLQEVLRS